MHRHIFTTKDMPQRHHSCPYNDLPDHRFWRRSVQAQAQDGVDPVTAAKFTIARDTRVATAGSCFAQHISRHLARNGFRYFVTEPGPRGITPATRQAHQYGVFSARYGNIYTPRQLLQLFERAFDGAVPAEGWWHDADGGGVIDPFRPTIQPEGFATEREAAIDRDRHLAAVRSLFENLDVFVFTLGLTEAWICREDGFVLPVAPGCAGGAYSEQRYAFHNFSISVSYTEHGFVRELFCPFFKAKDREKARDVWYRSGSSYGWFPKGGDFRCRTF